MSQKIYVDSSVLVFFFVTNFDKRFSKVSKDFLTRVESGKYEGMISLFVLMELIKQVRELLVKANICNRKDWDANIKKAVEAIYKMQNIKIVEGSSDEQKSSSIVSGLSHSEIAWESFEVMNKYQGFVKQKNNELEHDGIHPVDAVHITLAKKMGCSMIATLDRDFRETDGEIKSLLLQEDIF
jgi:predicted nucleic acid-binding protein